MSRRLTCLLFLSLAVTLGAQEKDSKYGEKTFSGLALREIGPALTSGRIIDLAVDPRDGRVWYIATAGGGVWKTTNAGTSFAPIFDDQKSHSIGCVTVVVFDPTNPDILYASAYQRRRHVFTLIDGGPESAIYKSTDAGKSWTKLKEGLPKEEMGRIGLAISPHNPKLVYATIESTRKAGGFFVSKDGGSSWQKANDYSAPGAQYYGEIFVDPNDDERIYSADVWVRVSDDGGKTWRKLDEKWKHPDNHVVWIDPASSDHLLIGCDGGLYESFDRAESWSFKANLPITQFYRVSADDALPFYSVYGGTQDNFSLGGPSRTTDEKGI